MPEPCLVEARMELPGIEIQICHFSWLSGLDEVNHDHWNTLTMALSPQPQGLRAYLETDDPPATRAAHYSALGAVSFSPAGIPLHYTNDGGHQRLLICRIDTRRISAGGLPDISRLDLRRSLDLRDPMLKAGLRRLAHEVANPGFGRHILVEAIVSAITVDLARALGMPDEKGDAPYARGNLPPWQLRRVREMVEGKATGPLPSVRDIAAALGISTRHLLRGFKGSTGSTLRDYLDETNADRARRLIDETDMSLEAIAATIGFSNQSSFTAAFRRRTGETPALYRRHLQHALAPAVTEPAAADS